LLGLFFDPIDGGDIFLRNVGWLSTDYTAFHLLACWFLLNLFILPWRWRRYVPPKRLSKLNGLHGVISQKMIHFTIHLVHIIRSSVLLTELNFNRIFILVYKRVIYVITYIRTYISSEKKV
jgi:hypothetical protein